MFVAGEIRAHDVRARRGLLALFEQVGKSLFHKGFDLTAFRYRKLTHNGQKLRVDLGSEFFAGLGHGGCCFYDFSVS